MLQPNKKKGKKEVKPKPKPKPNPIKKYKKASTGDTLAEDIFEVLDPTGISSYDDVYRSYNENGLFSWQTGLEVLGALPIIGKAGKGLKAAQMANKYAKGLIKANKVAKRVERVIPEILKTGKKVGETFAKASRAGGVNPIAATATVVGKGAETLQKVTKAVEKGTSKIVKQVIKIDPANKKIINEAVATVNTANTLSDATGLVKDQVVTPIINDVKENIEESSYVPIPDKKEKKEFSWKDLEPKDFQKKNLAYGTNSQGIMKSKMNPRKKYANGSDAKGMNVNNYVISPAEAMNDYNIMMAKVQQEAMSNPWLPIVAAVGGAAQSFVGNAGMYTKGAGGAGSLLDKAIPKGMDIIASTSTGSVEAAMGMNNVQADVEVEGGEMYETPQGQVGEFKGPSHEEEGIPLEMTQDPNANIAEGEVQEGTKVYSDRLKIQGKTLAERKEKRERLIANLEDTVSEPLVDQAIKNASKRKMMAIQKEEVADLDFQEKVNNIQQMADTMVAAFGTSMAGLQANPMEESMEYGYGSGMTGVQKYDWGTDQDGIDPLKPWMLPSSTQEDYDPNYVDKMTMDQIQTIIGSEPDGTWGRKDRRKARQFVKDKDQSAFPTWAIGGKDITKNQSDMEQTLADESFQKQFRRVYLGDPYSQEELDAQEQPINFIKPTVEYEEPEVPPSIEGVVSELSKRQQRKQDEADQALKWKQNDAITEDTTDNKTYKLKKSVLNESEENKPGTMFSRGLEKIGGIGGGGGMPGIGDMTKLIGNYLGMTSGIKTANEQRASDVTKTNVYKNAGEESQRLLDNAKKGIEISKAQAIVKANTNTRTGRKGARNSARGVNQMRAMDWLYDTALNQQVADISAGAAQQISGIDIQKSGVAMNADQLKGAGEWQATMANDADKDAYYTALALGRKDFATGMQQSGKDLNSMKESNIIENLMQNYGKWVGADGSGNIGNKNKTTTKTSTKDNIEIPDGKGGTISMTKAEFQKLMDKVTNTK